VDSPVSADWSNPISDILPVLTDSPLIQREGCIEEQGVYKEFKRLMDAGVPVRDSLKDVRMATTRMLMIVLILAGPYERAVARDSDR
jgi:hypothetical protein